MTSDIEAIIRVMDTQEERIIFVKRIIALSNLERAEFAETVLDIKGRTLDMKMSSAKKHILNDKDIEAITRYAKRINVYDLNGFKLYTDDILTVWRTVINFTGLTAAQVAHRLNISLNIIYPYYNGNIKIVRPDHMKALLELAHDFRLDLHITYKK